MEDQVYRFGQTMVEFEYRGESSWMAAYKLDILIWSGTNQPNIENKRRDRSRDVTCWNADLDKWRIYRHRNFGAVLLDW